MVTKRFVVIVGGWRPVGVYDTKAEAQAKADSCISAIVEICEVEMSISTLTEKGDDEE